MNALNSARVEVTCFGRISSELLAEAENFAAFVNLSAVDMADDHGASDLMRQFVAATPEWSAPEGSVASDARDGLCFSVVLS